MRSRCPITAAVLALLLASIPHQPPAADAAGLRGKRKLRLKFHAGELLTYEMTQHSTTRTGVAGIAIDMVLESTLTQEVTRVLRTGDAELIGRFTDMRIDAPMGVMSDLASKLEGMWFEMTVTPLGEVLDLRAHDIPPELESMMSSFEDLMRSFVPLPKRAVGPGDRWRDERTVTMALPGRGDVAYTINGENELRRFVVEHDHVVAIIDTHITIAADGSGATLTLTGEGEGTGKFDVDAGRWVSSDMDMTTRMNISGIDLDTKMVSKIRLVGVKR